MTNHPITPPPELVQQWWINDNEVNCVDELATRAAQWGADQELEACLKWMRSFCATWTCGRRPEDVLGAARRPKPPSLKEQALEELEVLRGDANAHGLGFDAPAIRRALEALDD